MAQGVFVRDHVLKPVSSNTPSTRVLRVLLHPSSPTRPRWVYPTPRTSPEGPFQYLVCRRRPRTRTATVREYGAHERLVETPQSVPGPPLDEEYLYALLPPGSRQDTHPTLGCHFRLPDRSGGLSPTESDVNGSRLGFCPKPYFVTRPSPESFVDLFPRHSLLPRHYRSLPPSVGGSRHQ